MATDLIGICFKLTRNLKESQTNFEKGDKKM